jgi:NhaP-type Na+/H+ or K+/H+ antiporter
MVGLASILLLGIGAQWLAWRLRLPSILLLLLVGLAAGPLSGNRLLDPDELFGDSLLPFVSLAVATILLEGGLTLRFRKLRGAGRAVTQLVVVGVPVTWALATLAARWTLGMEWRLALLLGAILVVTGPTVILPLLRHIRPRGAAGSLVRWEGIVTDPIGAVLAVLVFQGMFLAGRQATAEAVLGLLKALLAGGAAGVLGAGLLVLLLRRRLVPDYLHSGVALAIAIGAFLASNAVQHESGLLAVTLMGVALANQELAHVEHIIEFKENLRVLLISTLFILLAARLPIEEFREFDLHNLLFVAVLIVVVRPITIYLGTLGAGLTWRERAFAAWMAPRGIVAAAVASVFALDLAQAGYPDPDRLVSSVFAVILVTVTLYGLTAGPLARRLGLSEENPRGVLVLGAHSWARELAKVLASAGIEVLLVDANRREVRAARMAGLAPCTATSSRRISTSGSRSSASAISSP